MNRIVLLWKVMGCAGVDWGECGGIRGVLFFFFNDTATTEIYTLSLHDALPIWGRGLRVGYVRQTLPEGAERVTPYELTLTALPEEIGRAHV